MEKRLLRGSTKGSCTLREPVEASVAASSIADIVVPPSAGTDTATGPGTGPGVEGRSSIKSDSAFESSCGSTSARQ